MTDKTKPVCTECGSDDVRCDAYAIWDIEAQDWVLLTTFDNTDCEKCGADELLTEEVTQEMIEAGVRVLQDSGRLRLNQSGPDHLLVRSVLRAALSCRQHIGGAAVSGGKV